MADKNKNFFQIIMNNLNLVNDLNETCITDDIMLEDFQWNETSWMDDTIISQSKSFDSKFNNSIGNFTQSISINKMTCDNDEGTTFGQNKLNQIEIMENDELVVQNLEFSLFDGKSQELVEEQSSQNDINENTSFYGLSKNVELLIKQTKNITNLYDWQDECLKAVDNRKNLIYALPTSGGKTLVAEILMLKQILCHKKNVIFVLPYVAIVQEKIQTLSPFAIQLGFLLEEYAGSKGQYPPIKRRRKNTIFICTIEKASGLLNSLIETDRLDEIGLVVVDELHSLGENSGRGATLEGFLAKIIFIDKSIQIIGMSATIGNLNEIAEFLKADLYTKNFRPVELEEYVMCNDQLWQVDLKTDDILRLKKRVAQSYSETVSELDPDKIGGLVMEVVPKQNCLIFCASRKNCENVSLLMTKVLCRSLMEYNKAEKLKLLSNLKDEDQHICPILLQTIKYGVAYHHSGLTNDERRLLEEAFKDNVISVICCTSTLAAGVNLPARRVILRSPYVGSEFINLSRYKQMIGRAGRAGMAEKGESILICKQSDIPKVRELLKSKIEDCVSSLSSEENRGINNLILSSVMLSLVKTRTQIHDLVNTSLLKIQASQLNIDIKKITDDAIKNLIKIKALQVDNKLMKANMTIGIQSQLPAESTDVDRSIDLKTAYLIYEDLTVAQKHLMLCNDLHILFLVTPYHLADQLIPIGLIYYEAIMNLPPQSMDVARLLGINEVAVIKLREGVTPKNVPERIFRKFYLTLVLSELRQNRPLHEVADKYQVNRGRIQNLLSTTTSFAHSMIKFCQELPEFWAFTDLFTSFHKKLIYNCSAELEPLMELPAVKIARAKQMYNAGYKTLQLIASADPKELKSKINHLSRKTVDQIIVAAKLLIISKMENLKEEVDEMLVGLSSETCFHD
ncbi:Similar to HELQ: Helicase POLQ-like (Homo sapiens) [Cotesia congregata]|uniref:Similar to HELQ: Helicase POLQ-like (Homo sapiens) n=1 Tax=Cotesia congregata TaxID=51543 RepID=A0A8J2ECU0_COTCN|nr:Similar to HELQ: Helicase POLQ-like (Homo sapiens) [Cotesia congregata]